MKIQHIIVSLNVGGAEMMLKRLIESHRSALGYEHRVISLTDPGPVGAELRLLNIDVCSVGLRGGWDVPRALFRLFRSIREWKPDVVQTWMYHADLLGGLAAWAAGQNKLIWGIRTTNVEAGGRPGTTFVRNVCARLSRRLPQKIICAAESSKRSHVAAGYDAARMLVVPNGFDLSRLVSTTLERATLRSRCGFGVDDFVIGIVGRFSQEKDHENFVRAAGLVAQQYANVRFLLVGRGLETTNKPLSDWISQTGYADRFVLLGQRTDIPVCLAAMEIFCLSSRTEGFPNVIGEAMAMGIPCVTTDVGDAAMLVANTGIIVPKEDSRALADGLKKLLTMPFEARAELGRDARERICAEFTMDRAREQFEAAYRAVVEGQE